MMIKEQTKTNIINCSTFEELLTDYLDKTLESTAHKSVAAHALACPLCHSLLNDVKESLEVCRKMGCQCSVTDEAGVYDDNAGKRQWRATILNVR